MIDSFAMPAIRLMDGPDKRISSRIIVGDDPGVVFGSIIDDQNFNLIPERGQAIHRVMKKRGGVEGRNDKGDEFLGFFHSGASLKILMKLLRVRKEPVRSLGLVPPGK